MAAPVLLSSSAVVRNAADHNLVIGDYGDSTHMMLVAIISGRIPFSFTFPFWRFSHEDYKVTLPGIDEPQPPHPETDRYAFGPTWDRIQASFVLLPMNEGPWHLWAEGEAAAATPSVTLGLFEFDSAISGGVFGYVADYVNVNDPTLPKAPVALVPDDSTGLSMYCALDFDMKPNYVLVENPVGQKSFQAFNAVIVDNVQRGVDGEAYFISDDLPLTDEDEPVYIPTISMSVTVTNYEPPPEPVAGLMTKRTRLKQRDDNSARPGAGQNDPTSRQRSSRIKGYGTYL